MPNQEVLIVGGGIAGLCCARHLHLSGVSSMVLESSDQVGGRARTEVIDGFRLDRGFQVLLTEYPEAKKVLDYGKLDLKTFEPGALVRYRGKFHRFADPWRRPKHFLSTALSPLASFGDKIRVARLKNRVCRGSVEDIDARPEVTTREKLREEGFSDRIVDHFFKPFLGGVFLENELTTSSRKFEFVFRMFSKGDAALPSNGMGEIALQLAQQLPPETVQTNAKVVDVKPNLVRLDGGRELTAANIVIACEAPAAARLLGRQTQSRSHGVSCLYFSADSSPVNEAILVLNGERDGPINNLCVPSEVVPGCAPAGKALISVTVLGPTALNEEPRLLESVLSQLRDWYGAEVNRWKHLKTMSIPYALPIQRPGANKPLTNADSKNGIILCGDYLENASIQGAMVSGRRAAESILRSR